MKHPYICIAGKNNIAVDVLKYIYENYGKDNLCIVCNKTETGENSFQKSFRKYAQLVGIQEKSLEEVYEIPQLVFLSLEFDRIVKPELFMDARLYNIHFSLLPKYKGMYTSAHPILNGEKYSGVTLHYIDYGIDTGDIIDQERFEIENCDCRELYLKYIEYGTKVVIRNIDDIIWNKTIGIKQNNIESTYYSKSSISYNNIVIDINQTAYGIQKQINAFSFREYQLPKIFNKAVIDCRILDSKSELKPGTIICEGSYYSIIATVDYNIVLYYDRFDELMSACEKGDLDTVKEICVVRKHINAKDKNGWTPLIKATFFNNKEIVYYLLSIGADIHTKNRNGTNLLMYAKEAYLRTGDNGLFKLFINLNLSVKEKDYLNRDLISYINKQNITFEQLME